MNDSLKYQVYRIDKTPTRGNSHGVNRDETWGVELDAAFVTVEEARDYVVKMNHRHCGYELGVLYSIDKQAIFDRCINPKWCHVQRYFVGRPNIDMISERLQKDRVSVIRKSKL